MSAHSPRITKLNPTTINVAPSIPNGKTLKITISPHLSIQYPELDDPPTKARKDADGLFEVVVPVGGRVEVGIDIDGIEHLKQGGRGWYDYEIEGTVMDLIRGSFERNREVLHLEAVDGTSNSQLTLTPKNAAASRGMAIRNVIASSGPVAHLERLSLELTWIGAASIEEPSLPSGSASGASVAANTLDHCQREVSESAGTGPLSVWAKEQMQAGLCKLFRAELIKRFPLIFDRDFEQYLARGTPPASMSDSFNRCLQLSKTHSTTFLPEARRRVQALIRAQKSYATFRREQVDSLTVRGRRRARNAEQSEGGPSIPARTSGPSTILHVERTESQLLELTTPTLQPQGGPTLAGVLAEALARIGRHRWDRCRSKATGRLSHNRVQILDAGDVAAADRPSTLHDDLSRHTSMAHRFSSQSHPEYLHYSDRSYASFIDDSEDEGLLDYQDRFLDSDDDDDLLDDGESGLYTIWPSERSEGTGGGRSAPVGTDEIWFDDLVLDDQASDHDVSSFQSISDPTTLASVLTYHSDRPSQILPDRHTPASDFVDDDLDSMLSFTSPEETQTSESIPTTSSWVSNSTSEPMVLDDEDLFLDDDEKDPMVAFAGPYSHDPTLPSKSRITLLPQPGALPHLFQQLATSPGEFEVRLLDGEPAFDFLTDSEDEL